MKPILKKLSKSWLSKKSSKFHRSLFEKIDFDTQLIGIKGARGSGKTTLLHQAAKASAHKASQILYISCDTAAMAGEDLFEIATEFAQFGGKLLLVDEIHKMNDFSTHLKSIYDFLDIQLIFSGSSAILLEHNKGDLSRRATIFTLPVLSFREFIALKNGLEFKSYPLEELLENHEDIAFEIMQEVKPLELFSYYKEYGAYPFFKESVSDYTMRLQEVINTTIESDLTYIFKIDALKQNTLKKILSLLCTLTPYEINKSKLSNDANISWATLSKYLTYMQKGALLELITYQNKQNQLNKAPKILLSNPNLFTVLCANADKGSLRESFFVSQLVSKHTIYNALSGDFVVDEKYTIEIGGKSKDNKQIQGLKQAYIAMDDIESGYDNVIPLWLFGFLY